jgi:hypothetical protein
MKPTIRPFAIEAFPLTASLVVVPSKDDEDTVDVAMDFGGGEGPILAAAEWVPSAGMVGGGFLCWTINGELVTDDPRWLPTDVLMMVRRMARTLHTRQGGR